jgi:DNA-binding NtrC family response regulator
MTAAAPPRMRVLIADDEPELVSILKKVLEAEGYAVCTAAGAVEAAATAEREAPHLSLVDLTMPDGSGLDVLGTIREKNPEARVIIMTAFATAETAVEAMRQGALDYLIKPFSLEELKIQVRRVAAEISLERENRSLRRELARVESEVEIVGSCPALRAALDLVARVADGDTPVLVRGETGTGKELVARAIHRTGKRRGGPFVALNCGAVAETLLERELFGHERGAYTGAEQGGPGVLEAAADGTLLLDEIGEMSPALQVKLLRVLDGSGFQRVGGVRTLPCRARFVASTHRDLARLVRDGGFRQDLLYRLNTVTIELPPLRDRDDDVLAIADALLARLASERGRPPRPLDDGARRALRGYAWPGNVRELRNVLERALLLAEGECLTAADLRLGATPASTARANEWADLPLREARDAFERDYLTRALAAADGNITRAAARIGLDRKNLEDKMRKLGMK